MNREQMEKAVQTLIAKVLKMEGESDALRARVEKLESVLGGAVRVTPEEAQKLLSQTAGPDGDATPTPKQDVAEGS